MIRQEIASLAKNSNFETRFFDGGAALLSFPRHTDERGVLLPLEFDEMPFEPQRSFVIHGDSAGTVRGEHSHATGQLLLLCVAGAIDVLMRARGEEVTVQLHPHGDALLLGPGIWSRETYLEPRSILLAFASEPYDPLTYRQSGN